MKTKVLMLVSIAGHADPEHGHPTDFAYAPQDIVEIDSFVAEAWAAAGHCSIVDDSPKGKKK